MTIAEAAKIIGREGYLKLDDLLILVEVLDVRDRYGNTDYRVTPIGGSGAKWVIAERVRLIEDDKKTRVVSE